MQPILLIQVIGIHVSSKHIYKIFKFCYKLKRYIELKKKYFWVNVCFRKFVPLPENHDFIDFYPARSTQMYILSSMCVERKYKRHIQNLIWNTFMV